VAASQATLYVADVPVFSHPSKMQNIELKFHQCGLERKGSDKSSDKGHGIEVTDTDICHEIPQHYRIIENYIPQAR
jgi:hypothetical protein